MIIVNQSRDGFVNIDTINELTVEDCKVIARYGNNVTILGEYDSNIRCEQIIRSIVDSLRKGNSVCELPKLRN